MKRKAKENKGKQHVEETRAQITLEALELMKSGRLDWADVLCGDLAPRNYESGKPYRGANRLRLAWAARKAGWKDPRFMTYKQAQAHGLQVREGEKGTVIEHWKPFTTWREEEDKDSAPERRAARRVALVGCWFVFNVEQCDGEPEPLPEVGHSDNDLADVADLVQASSPCPVRVAVTEHACYSPSSDYVLMYPREEASSLNGWTRVLLHEMTHATGHRTRLDRPQLARFGSPDYAREELVAELGSAFLAAELGLPEKTDIDGTESAHAVQHAAYLQSWISVLENDPNELFHAAGLASNAADYIARAWHAEDDEEAQDEAA